MAKRAILLWLVLSGADLAHAVFVAKVASQHCVPRQECCTLCAEGQACGDSCMAGDESCAKAQGCACDDADVCR